MRFGPPYKTHISTPETRMDPHITVHFQDPEDYVTTYERSTTQLPPEPKEIKPHPYGVELGRRTATVIATPN